MSALTSLARGGAWLGVAAASAAVGFATERYVMGRSLRRDDPYADEQFGSLRGELHVVTTDDDVALHVEVDDGPGLLTRSSTGSARSMTSSTSPTVIFTHGYALSQDSWHFQRRDLRGAKRLVFWDVRGHGRSGPLPDGDVTIARLAADLEHVIDQLAPEGPIVLVGHSLGSMIVMALAASRPDLFHDRVAAVGLIATTTQGIERSTLGLPGPVGRMAKRAAPGAVAALARRPELVERGRRAGSDLGYVLTRRYSFAGGSSPALVEFVASMNASTPIDVVAAFLPLFSEVDNADAIPVLARIPVLVIGAEKDLLTPVDHGRELAEELGDAELAADRVEWRAERADERGRRRANVTYVEAEDSGHMVLLERPDLVTGRLKALIEGVP